MPSSGLSILEHMVEVALELYTLQNKNTDSIFTLYERDLACLIYKYYQVPFLCINSNGLILFVQNLIVLDFLRH